jgi:hypothetical protein
MICFVKMKKQNEKKWARQQASEDAMVVRRSKYHYCDIAAKVPPSLCRNNHVSSRLTPGVHVCDGIDARARNDQAETTSTTPWIITIKRNAAHKTERNHKQAFGRVVHHHNQLIDHEVLSKAPSPCGHDQSVRCSMDSLLAAQRRTTKHQWRDLTPFPRWDRFGLLPVTKKKSHLTTTTTSHSTFLH